MARPSRIKETQKSTPVEGVQNLTLGEFLSPAFVSAVVSPLPQGSNGLLYRIQEAVGEMFKDTNWRQQTVRDLLAHEQMWRLFNRESKYHGYGHRSQVFLSQLFRACGLDAHLPPWLSKISSSELSQEAQDVIKKIRANNKK